MPGSADISSIAQVIGTTVTGKKAALAFGGAAGIMASVGEDIRNSWPLVAVLMVPLVTAALFMGVVQEKLENMPKAFAQELAVRDVKINYAYENAMKGGRYTAEMAQKHDDLDDERYYTMDGRIGDLEHLCVETRKRVSSLEDRHKIGFQHKEQ